MILLFKVEHSTIKKDIFRIFFMTQIYSIECL